MALQTLLFPQDPFAYNPNDLYNFFGGNFPSDLGQFENEEEKRSFHFLENRTEILHQENCNPPPIPSLLPNLDKWVPNSALDSNPKNVTGTEVEKSFVHFLENQTEHFHQENCNSAVPPLVPNLEEWVPNAAIGSEEFPEFDSWRTEPGKPKRRRRLRSKKKIEDIEKQRMTHIAVERNRRKQMNDYLSALRQLMPESYVQRVDQASIVSGAINYVKDLEQQLQFLSGQKHLKNQQKKEKSSTSNWPFNEFFTFPQYYYSSNSNQSDNPTANNSSATNVGDIEVSLVESHASIKIRSKRRPKQLLRLLSGLQRLCLTLLHLNVTTSDQVVLYSLCLKVEDECRLTSMDEIATAIHQILSRIQEESLP
ncbi:hypothetical protein LguiA_010960 [Lonicera macranthoides]